MRLIERVTAPLAGTRTNRDRGIIHGVKLCGLTSKNGREYLREAFKSSIRKYDGVVIHFNHNMGREGRTVETVGGRIRNPQIGSDGTPRGDAHLLKSHPMYERVMEAAETDPSLFGFSHVAECRTVRRGGKEVVEAIEEVFSVDLVAMPATTRGLFESTTDLAEALNSPTAFKELVLCDDLTPTLSGSRTPPRGRYAARERRRLAEAVRDPRRFKDLVLSD